MKIPFLKKPFTFFAAKDIEALTCMIGDGDVVATIPKVGVVVNNPIPERIWDLSLTRTAEYGVSMDKTHGLVIFRGKRIFDKEWLTLVYGPGIKVYKTLDKEVEIISNYGKFSVVKVIEYISRPRRKNYMEQPQVGFRILSNPWKEEWLNMFVGVETPTRAVGAITTLKFPTDEASKTTTL